MPKHPSPSQKDVIGAIKQRLQENDSLTEFDFLRFRREANQLAPDPNGFAALGILACLEGDEKEMRKQHQLAIDYAGKAPARQITNYATSLLQMDFLNESLEQALRAWRMDPAEVDALGVIIHVYYRMNNSKQLHSWLRTWRDYVKQPHEIEAVLEEEGLSGMCALASESALAEVWDTPEEDEAWAHLQ